LKQENLVPDAASARPTKPTSFVGFSFYGVVEFRHMETTAPAPVEPAHQNPKLIRWAIVLGIVIILNVFFTVVRQLIFPAPVYEDFCPASMHPMVAPTEQSCIAQEGVWSVYPEKDPTGATGYCDFYQKCQKPWEAAMSDYQLRGFVLMLAFGIIALVAGVLLVGSSVVSWGLSYGGVVAFIIGSVSYWSEADNWIRLIISAIALAALLYLGWRKFKD
jgi:hypothetical protein